MEESKPAMGATGSGGWTRVIVLAPRAADGSPSQTAAAGGASAITPNSVLNETLRAEFTARDWFGVAHDDPYLALADLALRDRAQTARAAWGLQRMEQLALVILQPSAWPADLVGDLLATIARHFPNASAWTADDSRILPAAPAKPCSNGTMAAANSTKSNTLRVSQVSDQPHAVASSSKSAASPNAGDVTWTSDGAQAAEDRPGRLSREEIDMLLHEGESEMTQREAEGRS